MEGFLTMKTTHHRIKLKEDVPTPPLDEISRIIAEAVKRLTALRAPSGANRKNILQTAGYNDVIML